MTIVDKRDTQRLYRKEGSLSTQKTLVIPQPATEKTALDEQLMTEPAANLDFSPTQEQLATISLKPDPLPEPLADCLARILARIRATEPCTDEKKEQLTA